MCFPPKKKHYWVIASGGRSTLPYCTLSTQEADRQDDEQGHVLEAKVCAAEGVVGDDVAPWLANTCEQEQRLDRKTEQDLRRFLVRGTRDRRDQLSRSGPVLLACNNNNLVYVQVFIQ